MSDVYSLFEKEAADPQAFNKVREGDAKNLSSLIQRSVELDKQIKDTEAQLKDLQHKKRSVDEEDIPSIMQTMGVESLTVDGNKVTVDKFVSARIPETRKQEAFQYLRDVGEGDLIKNEVVVSFSMGQDNQAGVVVADLENKGFAPQKNYLHKYKRTILCILKVPNKATSSILLHKRYIKQMKVLLLSPLFLKRNF